jgi:hypothetical protein
MAPSWSSGMLSKGGEMTGVALASATATAPLLLLLRGGVPLSMSSGCARKKPVKSPDGAIWRPNTESVDIIGTGPPTHGVSVGAARTHGAPTQAIEPRHTRPHV